MQVVHNIASVPELPKPISLAVGTFDGLHMGHRRLLSAMKEIEGSSVVFTFINHPRSVLLGKSEIPLLTSPEYKIRLLEEAGIDFCIIQPFTKEMAGMHYRLFIEELYRAVPFQHLFLGEDASFGKDQEGNVDKLKELGHEMHFKVHCTAKLSIDGKIISSSNIRMALKKGHLQKAERMLGRPFSHYINPKMPSIEPRLLKPGKYYLSTPEKKEILCLVEPCGSIIPLSSSLEEGTESEILMTFIRKK